MPTAASLVVEDGPWAVEEMTATADEEEMTDDEELVEVVAACEVVEAGAEADSPVAVEDTGGTLLEIDEETAEEEEDEEDRPSKPPAASAASSRLPLPDA